MSRALDRDTAAAIHSGNPQAVYDDLVAALNPDTSTPTSTSTDLLEIEFLGKSHALPAGCHVLIDGASIAIPKTTLVQAFMVARLVLFKHLPSSLPHKQQEIRDAAAVMLLMDPEHVTAANARKRAVLTYRERELAVFRTELARERWWVDSMLTARLHRHTKSPTLWGHRRWLLEAWQKLEMPYDIHGDLVGVVLVAAERHACNYYAWLHLRWLVQRRMGACQLGEEATEAEAEEVACDGSKVLSTVKSWCLRHPGDTAGFSFLLFCLLDHSHAGVVLTGGTSRAEARSSVCNEVLDLALSFKWTNEAVWAFLRTLVASGVAEEQRAAFFESIKTLREARPGSNNAKGLSALQAAHDWCVEFEKAEAVHG
jgi:protein prenyltransferase alpha subunit repeat containing protein 1